MSNNHGVESTSPSRRSVVKGAAWAVPAVVVAGAAPTVAASEGFLTFTGKACKLPGNSSSTFKGFVFELEAHNVQGPNPLDAITEVLSISIQGLQDLGAYKVVVKSNAGSCSCGPCPGVQDHMFCTPDNTPNQRILIYTSADVTGNSANSVVEITYRTYDCNGTSSCGSPGPIQTASTVIRETPPAQEGGGGSCPIPDVFPLP